MSTATDGLGAASGLKFRPDIEGLRAVAVGLVVLQHAGVTGVSGGYIGVDVFFVISGFLITSLLVDEVRRSSRVSMLAFYARRARRILPVACFVIVVTVIASYLQLGALVGKTTATDGRWAAVFAANFRFIHQGTDYFASATPAGPLQHYWSLAVEEQFYLVWPVTLMLLVTLGNRFGRSAWTLRIGLLAIVSTSFWWSVHQTAIDRTTAYFSPLTRAWELGAGALIALFAVAIATIPNAVRVVAAWVGVALVLFAAFTLSASTPFPGSAALLPVAGATLIIAGGIGGGARGPVVVLGLPPIRRLGLISYSVYLWHWPVLVIAEQRSASPLSGAAAAVVCVLITLALSYASYTLIEAPFRSGRLLKPRGAANGWEGARAALAVGLAAIVFAVGVSGLTSARATAIANRASSNAAVLPGLNLAAVAKNAANGSPEQITMMERALRLRIEQGLRLHGIPRGVDPPVLKLADAWNRKFQLCLQTRAGTVVKSCTFGVPSSKKVLVAFGDSHSMQWMPAIDAYAKDAGYRVVTMQKAGCPLPDIEVFTQAGPYSACPAWKAKAFRNIAALKPAAIVVAFSQEFTGPNHFDLARWLSGLKSSLAKLSRSGAPVVEIGNNPRLPDDPGVCLTRPRADPTDCVGTYSSRERVDGERDVVLRAHARFIDVEPWLCVAGRCPPIIDSRIAYANNGHLSRQFVSYVAPLLAATLRADGLD